MRAERRVRYERSREEDWIAREQRLLSGADCKWTQRAKSPDWHCRMNGRLCRHSPTKDNMWNLHRATNVDGPNGSLTPSGDLVIESRAALRLSHSVFFPATTLQIRA